MIVAIVGRPNVGKSTLFNRLTETKQAIVDETSGVTRDRLYGKAEWAGKEFSVIDTGGYVRNSDDVFEEEIRKQVNIAIEEANVIIFLVDVTSGITDLDEAMAEILRKTNKKVFLVVNKVDNNQRIIDSNEFYKFGLGDPICVSAINGSGTGELLDQVITEIKNIKLDDEDDENIPKYAVVGRPNVGKSSLINALIGEERNIVTPISGTTRDSIYSKYNKYDHEFYLVDTAGLRKKGKVSENLEYYSVLRSIRAIERADVCLLLIDATHGIESQDLNILKLVQKNKKGLVILINKWDLIEKQENTMELYED
ncbi:MAG: ribosome biogenesis GTPase Der, partial [Bacteroidota bacterium]